MVNFNLVVQKYPLIYRTQNIKTNAKDKEFTELKFNSNLWLQKVNTKKTAKTTITNCQSAPCEKKSSHFQYLDIPFYVKKWYIPNLHSQFCVYTFFVSSIFFSPGNKALYKKQSGSQSCLKTSGRVWCSTRIKFSKALCFGNKAGEDKNAHTTVSETAVKDNTGHMVQDPSCPLGEFTEWVPQPSSHLPRHSPNSNGHVFLWLEVVITGVIQTLILWFFQVNEIGNPHCAGQRDGNQY